MPQKTIRPTLFEALLPIIVLVALLLYNSVVFGDASLDGSNQLALLFSAAVAGLLAIRLKLSWVSMLDGILAGINMAMPSILILLVIGALAGTWLISGIVPAMIYYGLQLLEPGIFLFAACIVCMVVSLATGSSWSTIATVGIALLGVGKAMGLEEGVIAGAIISGAYFGDKMSPLSDTTNLAPAMAGTELFTHIRYMLYTTVPSISIALVIFLIWGFTSDTSVSEQQMQGVLSALQESFYISPILFLVPIAVVAMIVKKVPALPALLAGTLLGGFFALVFQPEVLQGLVSGPGKGALANSYQAIMVAMYGNTQISTSNEMVNELLSAGGMTGMLNTVWLIICAMVFGGLMERIGFLNRIVASFTHLLARTGDIVASTSATCVFMNFAASEQYMSIVVPGRMYSGLYKEKGLEPRLLSRTLEDSGTVTSVLVPWNACGAYQAGVLGVATLTYAPFCFFNIISPFMSIFIAYLGFGIKRLRNQSAIQEA